MVGQVILTCIEGLIENRRRELFMSTHDRFLIYCSICSASEFALFDKCVFSFVIYSLLLDWNKFITRTSSYIPSGSFAAYRIINLLATTVCSPIESERNACGVDQTSCAVAKESSSTI